MIMKKLFCLISVLAVLLTFVGCEGNTTIRNESELPESVNVVSEQEVELPATEGLEYIPFGDSYGVSVGEAKHLEEIIIPSKHEGKEVTRIVEKGFADCEALTKITIPNSITHIGVLAFGSCTGLTSVNIPKSVKYIEHMAFFGCKNLTDITIADGVMFIGFDAFAWTAYKTDEKNWDNGAIYIDKYLIDFKNDIGGDYSIRNGTLLIAEEAFLHCSELKSVTIPESVKNIGDSAFGSCTGLTNVNIPKGVTVIREDTFSGCSSLTRIAIPDSVVTIGSGAFAGCERIESLSLPNSIEFIDSSAFTNCISLRSVTIPNKVTSLGSRAFYGCVGLTSVTIPKGILGINVNAFFQCVNLTNVTYKGSKAEWKQLKYNDWSTTSMIIHCSDGDINLT